MYAKYVQHHQPQGGPQTKTCSTHSNTCPWCRGGLSSAACEPHADLRCLLLPPPPTPRPRPRPPCLHPTADVEASHGALTMAPHPAAAAGAAGHIAVNAGRVATSTPTPSPPPLPLPAAGPSWDRENKCFVYSTSFKGDLALTLTPYLSSRYGCDRWGLLPPPLVCPPPLRALKAPHPTPPHPTPRPRFSLGSLVGPHRTRNRAHVRVASP
jgi:hypothetical protein